ncbi:YsnF/AvaK domain-containing protein [Erythrobacter sp. HL-111]|uniref:YsnF/AvaK domain-containing protein n=1 Tax=Erythrobacter sp. HL-111 TaxID=1798193 RepID=UPI0006DAF929|nr:YsnF/AvaK domain-containing protein [Erythrobacter sp. HL-111]KPP88364.1 MAG: hypothetical protein HLUCCO15_11630 [Erythrobacteraceae bacterium HL-111]SDS81017.1 conserved domain-containing protein [Erythrobacter sp. HL-111]
MRHDTRYEQLDQLSDYELEHSDQDIRGLPLVSPTGQRYGVIEHLLVDDDRTHVEAVRLDNGKVCAVEPLVIHDNAVVYGEEAAAHARQGGAAVTEEVVPVVEEKVAIGKRVSEHGRNISVKSRVVEDRVSEDVHLRDETVSVDRRPVDREVTSADADKLLQDRNVSMTEHDEEAVVGKKAVVKDEVVVRKTADDRVEHVEETARRTEVDVDVDEDRKNRRR